MQEGVALSSFSLYGLLFIIIHYFLIVWLLPVYNLFAGHAGNSTLHGNLDHLNRILSNRTLRSLARYGIAGDKTDMGAQSSGFVLVDEEDMEYIADIVEPTKEQMLRFLRAEKRRILNANTLQQEVDVPENTEADEDDEKLEELDYQRSMKMLAKIKESPGVIACCFVMTGTGSNVFYHANLDKREKSIKLFHKTLAKAIHVSTAEISIGKIQDTTSSVMSECCDIEVTPLPPFILCVLQYFSER